MDKPINYDDIVRTILNTLYGASMSEPDDDARFGVVLGGQPGVGKSFLPEIVQKEYGRTFVFLNGDDYRAFHPDYLEFQKSPATSSLKTQEFVGIVTRRLIDHFIKNKFNVVIEGTFRTSTVPVETLKRLKENAYKTVALVLTCDKRLSWESCEKRFRFALEKDLKRNRPTDARRTPREHHDIVVDNLAENVATVYEADVAGRMIVFARFPDGTGGFAREAIFDSEKHGAITPSRLRQAVQHVLDGDIPAAKSVIAHRQPCKGVIFECCLKPM